MAIKKVRNYMKNVSGLYDVIYAETHASIVVTSDGSNIETKISTLDSAIDSHTDNLNNPHGVTKTQIGLGNVDNTSDVNKPVSTAQQAAINARSPQFLYCTTSSTKPTVINGAILICYQG